VPAVTLYGIRNCDTIRKARAWLDSHGVAFIFHDYKVAGVDPAELDRWCEQIGWERLLNRAGSTFRRLPEAQRLELDDQRARQLMLAQPSMIRRPVLVAGTRLLVGFDPDRYAGLLPDEPRCPVRR